MSDQRPPMELSPRDAELIALYAEDLLTEEQSKELNARLHAESGLLAAIVQLTEIEEHLRVLLEEAHASDPGDWYEVMSELARVEDQQDELPTIQFDANPLTRQKYASALSYVLRHSFTPKRVAILVTAAVLSLGTVLVIVFMAGGFDDDPSLVETHEQPRPTDRVIDTNLVVATLTAEYDAVWDRRPGEGLYAGQRLKLLEGMAGIELAEGTRVVLAGPLSFEVIGRNALALYDGRLVAHVPPSGYGFMVDTPTARIIDYGTEFGVAAEGDRETQVHVFGGEVGVAARRGGVVVGEPVPLLEKQGAIVHADQASVARVDFDGSAFERRVVKRLDVVDIVGGGDGTGKQGGVGIDLASGRYVTNQEMASRAAEAWTRGSGRESHKVTESRFIDRVFVIDRLAGRADITSRGDLFAGFPTVPEDVLSGDGFGFIQATHLNTIVKPLDLQGYLRPFSLAQRQDLDGRYVVIHGGSGVTLDLQALAHKHGGATIDRFKASVLNIEALSQASARTSDLSTADVWVIIDGEPRFQRRSIRTEDGVVEIDVPLKQGDRFLTLAVSHGGDGIYHDWVVFGRPMIECGLDIQRFAD